MNKVNYEYSQLYIMFHSSENNIFWYLIINLKDETQLKSHIFSS